MKDKKQSVLYVLSIGLYYRDIVHKIAKDDSGTSIHVKTK